MKKIVFMVFFLLFIPFTILSSFAQRPHIPLSSFEIVSFRGEWQHDTLYVIGEIKNTGHIPGGVKVEAIARDSQGVLIDSQKFWPNSTNNIQPGGSCGIKHHITDDDRASRVEIKVIDARFW